MAESRKITPLDTFRGLISSAERTQSELESYRDGVQKERDRAQSELDAIDAALATLNDVLGSRKEPGNG
jgi:hypothetical protein